MFLISFLGCATWPGLARHGYVTFTDDSDIWSVTLRVSYDKLCGMGSLLSSVCQNVDSAGERGRDPVAIEEALWIWRRLGAGGFVDRDVACSVSGWFRRGCPSA